jgi:hypothetical protein
MYLFFLEYPDPLERVTLSVPQVPCGVEEIQNIPMCCGGTESTDDGADW